MTDNTNETLDEQNLRETIEEMNLKFFDWLKSITTIAAGLIAVLVSLKNSNPLQKLPVPVGTVATTLSGLIHFQQLSFFVTILLLSLGILFSTLALYQQVALLRSAALVYHARIQKKQRQSVTEQARYDKKTATGMKSFPLVVRVAYVFYILGLLSLVTYAYFISGI